MIKINDIYKSYDHTRALAGVSLDIGKGEFWGLVGPNGSGKTTLYKCVMGLLTPDNGSIEIDGLNNQTDAVQVKSRIGYSAEPPVLYDYLTGREYLEFIGKMNGMKSAELSERRDHLLQVFDLGKKSFEPIADYSHGMRKKISLAAALLKSPPILMLDEPTGGLDAESIFNLKQYLLNLRNDGCTLLLSSHSIDTVEKLCTHIAVIADGKILMQNRVANLIQSLGPGETLETFFVKALQNRS